MRETAVAATARTPIGKAYRAAFNDTQGQHLAAHACVGSGMGAAGLFEVAS